jgi:hypothetical protein
MTYLQEEIEAREESNDFVRVDLKDDSSFDGYDSEADDVPIDATHSKKKRIVCNVSSSN